MNRVNVTIKGLGALAVGVAAYVNHTFGMLFWVLLSLAAVDLLLNVHDEQKQLAKFGSAFASIGGITVLESHLSNPEVMKIAVAVAVLAYIQVVTPQLVSLLGKLHLPKRENKFLVAMMEQEIARLKAEANQQAGTASASNPQAAPVHTPGTAGVPK